MQEELWFSLSVSRLSGRIAKNKEEEEEDYLHSYDNIALHLLSLIRHWFCTSATPLVGYSSWFFKSTNGLLDIIWQLW
jgi:hypothetical protein